MFILERCWVCGDLATEREDSPLGEDLYVCDRHHADS